MLMEIFFDCKKNAHGNIFLVAKKKKKKKKRKKERKKEKKFSSINLI